MYKRLFYNNNCMIFLPFPFLLPTLPTSPLCSPPDESPLSSLKMVSFSFIVIFTFIFQILYLSSDVKFLKSCIHKKTRTDKAAYIYVLVYTHGGSMILASHGELVKY